LTGLTLEVRATYRGALTEPLDQETGQGFGVSQFSYATYIAEVEVDTDTGEVSVLRVDTFIDAGRVVRPKGAEMQVEGGVVMGLGHTLTEEFVQKEGLPQTEGLATYLIPTIADVPFDINCTFVDERAPIGELGAKGLAELTLVPIAPAIINAIYDAVGVRITRLPASPERVLLAIEGQRFGKTTKDTYD
jgi:CO/xanthine dehydrogenase Mo-binding subunit